MSPPSQQKSSVINYVGKRESVIADNFFGDDITMDNETGEVKVTKTGSADLPIPMKPRF